MGRVRRTLAKISRNVLRVLIKVIRKIRAKIFSNGFTSFLRVCKTLEHKARFGKQLERPKRPKAKRTSCVFYLFAVICLGNKQSGRSAQDICAALKSMLWKSSERQWVEVGGGKCGKRGPARKTPQIGQNFSLSSHNKPEAEKLIRLGEIIKRQLLQRLIADIRTAERQSERERERGGRLGGNMTWNTMQMLSLITLST